VLEFSFLARSVVRFISPTVSAIVLSERADHFLVRLRGRCEVRGGEDRVALLQVAVIKPWTVATIKPALTSACGAL
jgi:hypothetical protein